MALVRTQEEQAQALAHFLDDLFRIPGTRMRVGADPLLGLIPVVGDVLALLLGLPLLVIARRLNVSWRIVALMVFNQFKNGLIGAIPFMGDAYSFHFKSNAINAALLLRAVKQGHDGTCPLTAHAITLPDVAGLAALTVSAIVMTGFISLWFWDHNISYISLFFPAPYRSR
jgi:hypothetical protein